MKKFILTIIFVFFALSVVVIQKQYLPFVQQKISICIQPFGDFDTVLQNEVRDALTSFYKCEVVILNPMNLPKESFVKVRSPRYRADSLIRFLRSHKPKGYNYIIGLTNKDISTTKYSDWKRKTIKDPEWKYKDFGIFGLGFKPGNSCIVSTYRLYSGGVGKSKMIERLKKISCHEIGHNMGLPHCTNDQCFMRDACESIKTIDAVSDCLCEECFEEIK